MSTFSGVPTIAFQSIITSSGLNTNFTGLTNAILQTPTNVDMSGLSIYQAFFYGLATSNSASVNGTDINSAVQAAGAIGGGLLLLPNEVGTIPISGATAVGAGTANNNLWVLGASGDVKFVKSDNTDLFTINNPGGDATLGGTLFQNFQVGYSSPSTPWAGGAIDFQAGQEARVKNVGFTDCPIGVYFSNILEGEVDGCTFIFTNAVSNSTGVMVTGPNANGSACNQILVKKLNARTSTTPNTYNAANVTQCEHASFITGRVGGLGTAINIAANSHNHNNIQDVFIADYESGTWGCGVNCVATAAGSWIGSIYILGCNFTQTNPLSAPWPSYTGGGLYCDATGVNTQLDTVQLVLTTFQGWFGYGVQLNTGQNFEMIGGTLSANALGGAAITGAWNTARFMGVNMTPLYLGLGAPDGSGGNTASQPYALVVTGNPNDVTLLGCDMRGYGQSLGGAPSGLPVHVPGAPARLVILNCPGYNDMQTVIHTAPGSGSPFSAATYGYYGPSVVYIAGATAININSVATGLTSGSFRLEPGSTMTYTGSPSSFNWIGV